MDYVSVNQGMAWAEVVFCALPLTDQTRGMLNARIFRKSAKGVYFINVGRAEVSPAKDLSRLLNSGVLKGLALDVFPQEGDLAAYLRGDRGARLGSDARAILKLKGRTDVIFTPHNAFNTAEASERKARLTVEAIEYFLKHKKFPCMVT